MEIELKSPKEWLRELWVSIEPERLSAAEEAAMRSYQEKAQIPGFRLGHVPRSIVKSRFGDAIRKEARDHLIKEAYEAALVQYDLHPITPGKVKERKMDDHGFSLKIVVEVIPDFPLQPYQGIRLKRSAPPRDSDLVNARLEELRAQLAQFIPVKRPAQTGDFLLVDYLARDERGPHKESKVLVQVGDPLNRPEVNQALKNTVAGQEVSLEIAPEAQGEEPVERVSYRFWIREVQERQLPEVDDEMARSLGFEDLQALTAELTRQAAARAADFAAQQLRYQLYDKLVDAHNFTPPGSFVEMIYREILIQNRLEDSDAIRSRLLPQAERRAKLDLIIERIAQAEGIEVTPEEVRTKVTSYAQGLGLKPEELLDSFYRLRRIQGIRAEIRHEKVTNWLLARAVVEG